MNMHSHDAQSNPCDSSHTSHQAGSSARPTCLVLDFFTNGQIHAVQPDEDHSELGPGGRRKQRRRVEACDEKFQDAGPQGRPQGRPQGLPAVG